jgi:hypothetical protein
MMLRKVARLVLVATLAAVPVACAQSSGPAVPPSAPAVAHTFSKPMQQISPRGNLFPNTDANVHLEMVFNDVNPNVETGVIDMVWGSNYATKPKGVYNTAYMAYAVDDRVHNLTWYKANHPDWIEYRCDRTTPAYQFGARTQTPLDFTNPAVQAYQWAYWVDAPLKAGYAGIDVDTITLTNDWKQSGHSTTGRSWVPQFTGQENDAAFRAATTSWEANMYAHVHAQTPTATLQVNYSYEFGAPNDDNIALMTRTDLVFDERGFTNWGSHPNHTTAAQWRIIVAAIAWVESKGGCYMTNAEEPGLSKDISPAERQWVIANYLLVKNSCTYMYMSGFNGNQQDYGRLILFPEYSIAIGTPVSAMSAQQGLYARSFTNGLAIVNPSATAHTFTLPAGTYKSVTGQTEGPSVVLGPTTGLVLVK